MNRRNQGEGGSNQGREGQKGRKGKVESLPFADGIFVNSPSSTATTSTSLPSFLRTICSENSRDSASRTLVSMAYCALVENEAFSGRKLHAGDGSGDYVNLVCSELEEGEELGLLSEPESPRKGCSFCWWLKMIAFCCFMAVGAGCFVTWGLPFVVDEVVIPFLGWEKKTFSTPMLGLLLVASMAVFPSLFLPSTPSMWIAGIAFGYDLGFLLIVAGTSLGMSFPYFIGSLFRHRIHKWLGKWPDKAAALNLASEGPWFHQFRAIALLRISPIPYIVLNYAVVATNIGYSPYIIGSIIGTMPDAFIAIYSGILIKSLADATHGGKLLSMQQEICNMLGFCIAIAAAAVVAVYAKQALNNSSDR
ncbi:hypothetical protein ACLOJK_005310 [Asimina triloba]